MSSWNGLGAGWHGPPGYMQPMQDPRTYQVPLYPTTQPIQGYYNYGPNRDIYALMQPTAATHPVSSKYPTLNPILAEDTTFLRFDTKSHPQASIVPGIYHRYHGERVLNSPAKKVVLISREFPWQIEIVSPAPITCENIWISLYNALQQPIVDSEWGFIVREKGAKERIEDAMKKRLESDKKTIERGPKRIDFLGNTTLFRGLEKDEDLAKLRRMPHTKACEETWVVKLIS